LKFDNYKLEVIPNFEFLVTFGPSFHTYIWPAKPKHQQDNFLTLVKKIGELNFLDLKKDFHN
jgi:hypothetical protein